MAIHKLRRHSRSRSATGAAPAYTGAILPVVWSLALQMRSSEKSLRYGICDVMLYEDQGSGISKEGAADRGL